MFFKNKKQKRIDELRKRKQEILDNEEINNLETFIEDKTKPKTQNHFFLETKEQRKKYNHTAYLKRNKKTKQKPINQNQNTFNYNDGFNAIRKLKPSSQF